MFRTHPSTSLGPYTSGSDSFYWSCIEHNLALPWFYIALKNKASQTTTMLQIMDPRVFSELSTQGDETNLIEYVQLVSPPYMNGSSTWKMEKLCGFSYGHSQDLGSFEIYELEHNKIYTTLETKELYRNIKFEKIPIYTNDRP